MGLDTETASGPFFSLIAWFESQHTIDMEFERYIDEEVKIQQVYNNE